MKNYPEDYAEQISVHQVVKLDPAVDCQHKFDGQDDVMLQLTKQAEAISQFMMKNKKDYSIPMLREDLC